MERRDLEVGMRIQFDTDHWGVIEEMDGAPISVRFADNGKKAMISAFFDEDLSVNVNHVSAEERGIRFVIGIFHPATCGFVFDESMAGKVLTIPRFDRVIYDDNKLNLQAGDTVVLRNGDFCVIDRLNGHAPCVSRKGLDPYKLLLSRFDCDGRFSCTHGLRDIFAKNQDQYDIVLVLSNETHKLTPSGCSGVNDCSELKEIRRQVRDTLKDISLNFETTEAESKHKVITGFINKLAFIFEESNRVEA